MQGKVNRIDVSELAGMKRVETSSKGNQNNGISGMSIISRMLWDMRGCPRFCAAVF